MPTIANRNPRGMDPLVRMMLLNWFTGIVVGLVCAGFLLAVDMAGMRSLLLRSNFFWQGLALLFGGFAITFGGVVCATSIMTLPKDDKETPRGGLGQKILSTLLYHSVARPALRPIPVPVKRARL